MRNNSRLVLLSIILIVIEAKIQCPPSCRVCTDTGMCISCTNQYKPNENGRCEPSTFIDGCLTYSTQIIGKRQCQICAKDRMLILGRCVRYPKNCQSLDQLFQCKKCEQGYELVGRSCFSTNITYCPLGHFPFKSYCRNYPLNGCLAKRNQHCQVCSDQYSLVNGVCIPKTCSQKCENCLCKGTIHFSNCLTCKPNNCLKSQNNLHCNTCEPAYSLIHGQCYKTVKPDDINCNVLDPQGQLCAACNQDYKMDKNNYCVRNFIIQDVRTCQDNKWMEFYQRDCYHRDRFCERIDGKTYQCLLCQDGFQIRAGKCERVQKCARTVGSQCVQCMPEYYLTSKRQCEEKPKNCLVFNAEINQCFQCKPPFTLLTSQSLSKKPVCANVDQKCTSYNVEGFCSSCETGFVLKKWRCAQISANCQIPLASDASLCVVCFQGFHLQDQLCYQNVKNCIKYGNSGNCSQCSKELLLHNNRCSYVDKYCLQVDKNGNCMRCSQGLMPYGNKCVYFESFCENYGNDRMCNQTYNWFRLKLDVSESAKQQYRLFVLYANLAKPASLTSETKVYSPNGIIQFFPILSISSKSIKSVRSDQSILECRQQYILKSGICIKKQQLVQNCKEYSVLTSECVLCQKGYDMNQNSKCQARSQKSCADRELSKDSCFKCNVLNGYFNVGGWCISKQLSKTRDSLHFQIADVKIMWPLLPNCVQQKNISKCEICLNRYTNRQGKCVLYQKYCENYHPLGFCQKCMTGYSFQGENCIPTNCEQKCLSCKPGYQYQGGKCFPQKQQNCAIYSNSNCIICQPQYFLSSTTKKCELSLPNCAIMNENTSHCKQCKQNYILYRQRCLLEIQYCKDYTFDGKCMICESTSAGVYQLINDTSCVKLPNRCVKLSKLGICQVCEVGYSMIKSGAGSQCVVLRENCRIYDQTGRCSACLQYFTLRNGLCQLTLTIPNCNEVNPATKRCNKCAQKYQLNDGVCINPDVNCKQYRNGLCVACVQGYYLSDNGCELKPLYCQSYNHKQKRCEHCISKYLLFEGKCTSKAIVLNGCIDQNSDESVCLDCQLGFRIKDGLCYAHNCLTYTMERNCDECPPYYRKSFTDPRICEPHFCKTYSKGPSCDTFQSDYIGGFLVQQYGVINVEYCKEISSKTKVCIKCDKYRSLQADKQGKYSICMPSNCANQNQVKCSQCKDGYVRIESGACAVQHCSAFNQAGLCEICQNQYLLNSTTNLCEMRSRFCYESDANGYCVKCMEGYALTIRKSCVAQIKGCRNYGSFQCFSCNKGLQYISGGCRVINCLTFKQKDSTICETCKQGYELTSQGLCKTKNCDMFSQEGWSCNGCFGRFSLTQGLCQTRNCAMFSVTDQVTCILCQQNYDLVNGTCLHKNCINPKDTTCKSCIQGWLPDQKRFCIIRDCLDSDFQTGQCTACKSGKRLLKGLCVQDHCLSRSNIINQCTLCENSFYLANQRQYCVAYFCKNWDNSNGECWQCAYNFSLQSGKCVNKLCTKFQNTNSFMPKCTSCVQGYIPYLQYCVPQKCNKQSYNPLSSSCQICVFGFQPIDGVCKLSNCRQYQQNVSDFSICVRCHLGFANQAGLCLPQSCQQFIPSTTKCNKCNPGFHLHSQICLATNCQIFSDEGQCTKCQPLYRLTNESICTRSNCLEDTLDTCLKCQDGYEVDEHTGGFCQPVNCQRIDEENNTCKRCMEGYVKDDGICIDLHCEKYSVTYNCLKCKLGFKFRSKQICQLTHPNFCPPGQYYSEVKQICQKIPIPNCRYSDYNQPNVCIDCMQNYFLQNGFCYSFKGCTKFSYSAGCRQCENDYKLVQRRCVDVKQISKDPGCQIIGNTGECQICKKGFVRVGKSCVPGRENCLEVNDKGGCNKCKDKYHVRFDGYCYQNGQFCLEANLMGRCLRCESGYQLNQTICSKQHIVSAVKTLPVLAQPPKKQQPVKYEQKPKQSSEPPKTPQVPKDHSSYIEHCLFQDDFKEACIICDTQYYITVKGKCLPMPDNCKFVNMQGVCFYCQDGFTLDKNICVQRKSSTTQTQPHNNKNQVNDFMKVGKSADNLRNQWKN